ncbi:hypothetical protein [Streptomyces sp. NPDC058086]|uniref:hypothetical protein n=1 Tax=Streptomyces sp. NPDC058086 TaxID=3346334 RepID=UPI0036E7DAD5
MNELLKRISDRIERTASLESVGTENDVGDSGLRMRSAPRPEHPGTRPIADDCWLGWAEQPPDRESVEVIDGLVNSARKAARRAHARGVLRLFRVFDLF